MKKLLLPILLVSIFACKKNDNTKPSAPTSVSIDQAPTYCMVAEEYQLSNIDSSKTVYVEYTYQTGVIRKANYPSAPVGSSVHDSTLFIYDGNNQLAYSIIAKSGNLDTLETFKYDQEQRLIEVTYFNNGISNRTETMTYDENGLKTITAVSNIFTDEFEVKTENGEIKEIVLSKRNGQVVDSNQYRQEVVYDTKVNPFYKKVSGNFNRLSYFNRHNITQYRLIHYGNVDQNQSYDISYIYNELNYPIEKTSTGSFGTNTSYFENICR